MVYLSPALSLEEVVNTLEIIMDTAESSSNQVIIAGDFNMKHKMFGCSANCLRGETVVNLLQSHGFICQNVIDEYNYTYVSSGCESSILDLYWTKNIDVKQKAKVDNSVCFGNSYHRPVILEVSVKNNYLTNDIRTENRIRYEELEKFEKRKMFIDSIDMPMKLLENEIDTELQLLKESKMEQRVHWESTQKISTKFDFEFNKILFDNAKKICGTKLLSRKKSNFLESKNTCILSNKLNAFHRLSSKFPDNEDIKRSKQNIIEELLKERTVIRKKSFDLFAWSLSNLRKPQQQKTLKRLAKSKLGCKNHGLKNCTNDLNNYSDYFKDIFNSSLIKDKHVGFNWELNNFKNHEIAEEIFNESIITNFIKYSPLRKAPGDSQLTNGILRISNAIITPILKKMFQFYFLSGSIPISWNKVTIIPIFKKGIKDDIKNYRPISLLENTRKLFERCIQDHMRITMKRLQIQQGGFQYHKATLDQVICLADYIKIYKKKFSKCPVVCYLDIKAAYDTVDRNILYEDCIKMNISPIVVESIRQLFEFNTARLKISEKYSRSFHMSSGVQQGSMLSPLLYSIFIDKLITKLNEGPGLNITDELKANCLLYADDIVLVSKNESDMTNLLEIAQESAIENNYRFNIDKCAYTCNRNIEIKLNDKAIKKVSIFNYLGINFKHNGISSNDHFTEKRRILSQQIQFFSMLGMNASGYTIKTKVLLYKSFIRSRLEYGLQIFKPTKKLIKVLNQIQYEALCKMFSISRKSSLRILQQITGIVDMKIRVDILKYKWINRFKAIFDTEKLLVCVVEKWVKENNLIPHIDSIYEESPLNSVQNENCNEVIAIYTREFFEERSKEIRIFNMTPLNNLSYKDIQSLFLKNIESKWAANVFVKFLLGKLPGKPSVCKHCCKMTSKYNMVFTCPKEWLCFLEELFSEKQLFRSMVKIDNFFKEINLLPFNMMALVFKIQNESLQRKKMERLAELIMKSCKVMLGW